MKTNHKLGLAVLAGFSIGAAASRAISAQQVKTAPTYLISEADAITDLTAVKKYGEKVPETLAPFPMVGTTLSLPAASPTLSMAKHPRALL